MQRPPSFVLLDPDTQSSSSEHEDIVEIPYDASKESSFSSEEVVVEVPLPFEKSHIKVDSKIEALSLHGDIPSMSSKDLNSCSTSNDACVDIAELLPILSEKFSDTSNESSLSPEEVVVDAPQLSGRQNSDSYSKTEDSSRPEVDSQKESLKSVSKIGPEVDRDTPSTTENEEITTAGGMIMGAGEDLEDSGGTRPNDSPLSNFFLRIFDLIGKISEITDHIDNTSKLIALCAFIAAVLIPTATICLDTSWY